MIRDLPAADGHVPFRPTPQRRRAVLVRRRVTPIWCNRGRYVCDGQLSGHGELSASVVARQIEFPQYMAQRWHYALIAWHPTRRMGQRDADRATFSFWPTRTAATAAAQLLAAGVPFSVVDTDPPRVRCFDSRALDLMILAMRHGAREQASAE